MGSQWAIRICVVLSTLGNVASAYGDVVTTWNSAALDAIRSARTSPPQASRALAILHAAIYDAVNGISRTHDSYLVPSAVPASASMEAAATSAARSVLVALFPASSARFDALFEATLAAVDDGPQKVAGTVWGNTVAAQILHLRSTDGADDIVVPVPGSGPGAWVPTPPANAPYLLPQWAFLAPFAMPSSTFFRPLGPPSLASERYTADFNEVKALGAAVGSSRTVDETQIALFWADGAGTETPAGHWNSIARGIAQQMGTTLIENARLFALLNIALADAAVYAWDAKYVFSFWRPVTAIRNADDDGNPQTSANPTWSPLLTTPPFPDYVSGHSTFSAAAATIFARFFGRDDLAFATGSDFLPGVTRQFPSFSAAAQEAAVSRIYGGIHFRTANEDGMSGGIEIGEWVYSRFLRPKGNRSRK